jgi:LmbE family N-acetylglucosaminyl deacetylase
VTRQSNTLGLAPFALASALMGCAAHELHPASRAPLGGPVRPAAAPARVPGKTLHVVAVVAHPDDVESGCGGTLARYAEAGHKVTIVHLTRGELGIEGQPPDVTARTRTAEANEAGRVLGAKVVFAGQVNGQVEATNGRAEELKKILLAEAPDVVFAPWPFDTDFEHQLASALTLRVYLAIPHDAPLYYYEIDTGANTLGFPPSTYVDISTVRDKKVEALKAHASQSFVNLYEKHDEKIEAFRGRELGVFAAEAFAVLGPDTKNGVLPGL